MVLERLFQLDYLLTWLLSRLYLLSFGSSASMYYLFVFCFFFFQAEDGIRDFHVTGVQTCALPISACRARSLRRWPASRRPSACRCLRAIARPTHSRGARAAPPADRRRWEQDPSDQEIGRASCRERV